MGDDSWEATVTWQVYIIRCSDGTLYTGVARDVARRVQEHNGANGRGAKYTKGRRPVLLSYTETFPDISSALKREACIKRLSKAGKERLTTRQGGALIPLPSSSRMGKSSVFDFTN